VVEVALAHVDNYFTSTQHLILNSKSTNIMAELFGLSYLPRLSTIPTVLHKVNSTKNHQDPARPTCVLMALVRIVWEVMSTKGLRIWGFSICRSNIDRLR